MLKQSSLSSVEYYLECANADERDAIQYYVDSSGEPPGRWWSPTNWLVENGAEVAPAKLRTLAGGFDPASMKRLVQSNKNHRPGYDLTFSAPKPVTALWAAGNEEQRKLVKTAHDHALQKTLQKIQDLELIETRCGKGGTDRQIPIDLLAAVYDHHSTRAGDPQIHSHVILLNLCCRADGTTGAIDNIKLKKLELAMGSYYRSELAAELQSAGLKIQPDGDAFTVAGVPPDLSATWSKRRASIEAAAKGEGFETSENSQRAQQIALETRTSKNKQPSRSEMEQTWRAELAEIGLSGDAVWRAALAAPPREKIEEHAEALACVSEAVAELIENESVIEHRQVLKAALVKSQGRCRPDLIWPAVEAAERDGLIVRLSGGEEDDSLFSTPSIIRTEQELIQIAMARKAEREFVKPALVEQALQYVARTGRPLDPAQEAAARHALNDDGISIIEGRAGTGKSTTLAAVHAGLQRAGLETHVVAPSWRATKNAASDLKNLRREQARALAGFLSKIEDGRIKLDRHAAVIVDEAGMVSTTDMHRLILACSKANAKVILAGDSKQLSAVAAGDPLSLLTKACGSAKLEKIVRQNQEWMRVASQNFASGKHREAIQAYHEAGHIHLMSDRKTAIDAVVSAWLADVHDSLEPPPVLASRNADVAALNQAIRTAAVQAGLITGPAVEIEAIGRAKGAKPAPLTVQAGDKIIFSENLKIADREINNNDVVTVVSIKPGRRPILKLRLEGGSIIAVAAQDLAGPKGRPLKLQHAFAMTIHASQGSTFNRTLVFDSGNMRRSSSYVAMTRHRADVRVFVDGAALASKRQGQADAKISLARARQGGGLVSGAGDNEGEEYIPADELEEQDLLGILTVTWGADDQKRNASDVIDPARLAAAQAALAATQQAEEFPAPRIAARSASARRDVDPASLTTKKVKRQKQIEDELRRLVEAIGAIPAPKPHRPKM